MLQTTTTPASFNISDVDRNSDWAFHCVSDTMEAAISSVHLSDREVSAGALLLALEDEEAVVCLCLLAFAFAIAQMKWPDSY